MGLPTYSAAKPLNLRLRQGVNDHFDNRQYAEGFKLLQDLLTTGYSAFGPSTDGPLLPTWVPDPQHLALAATVIVHPHFTTRARTYEQHTKASQEAWKLLNQVNTILGPVNADLTTSLAFKTNVLRRATQMVRRRVEAESRSPGTPDLLAADEATTSVFAGQKCIFDQRADFWNVVGWTFSCSLAHHSRWSSWSAWLTLTCDIIESDWHERLELAREMKGSQTNFWALQTLLLRYTKETPNGNDIKRYLRAILSNGNDRCMNEFPEIWADETKQLRKPEQEEQRREDVDLDNDIWGDYDQIQEEDEDDLLRSSQPVSESDGKNRSNANSSAPQADSLGGNEAIKLRWRLIRLLLTAATTVPDMFIKSEVILDNLVYAMREMPYESFVNFIRSSSSLGDQQAPFLVNFLIGLTSINMKTNIFAVSRQLELSLFTLTANTNDPADNAKVSRILVALLQALNRTGQVQITSQGSGLRKAIEKGIAERHSRVTQNKKSREGTRADLALTVSDGLLKDELTMIEDEAGVGSGISFCYPTFPSSAREQTPDSLASSGLSSLSETPEVDEEGDETMIG